MQFVCGLSTVTASSNFIVDWLLLQLTCYYLLSLQVYHLCRGSEMTTLSCPDGQAFDHLSNECKEQDLVDCVETEHSHRHKRSTNVVVHSIEITELKFELKKLCEQVRYVIRSAVKEVAPTVYSQIEANYAPVIQKFKTEVMPFVKTKVVPRLQKAHAYIKRLSERVFEKVYRSYELSNSTHIVLVTFSDLARDIAKDLEPFLKTGKYLSSKLARA